MPPYKRGMKLMAIPTTLLSQVDSSIGGKNGINYGGIKNVIGTFYEPSVVLADTYFLTASEDSYLKDKLKAHHLAGTITPPSSKSFTQRYILLAMTREGSTKILNVSGSDDEMVAMGIARDSNMNLQKP